MGYRYQSDGQHLAENATVVWTVKREVLKKVREVSHSRNPEIQDWPKLLSVSQMPRIWRSTSLAIL